MQTGDKDSPADRFRRQVPGVVIAVIVTAIGITFLAGPEPSPPVRADNPGRLTALAFERTTIRARTSVSASSPAGSATEVSVPGDVIGSGTATETTQPPADSTAPETTANVPPDPPPGDSTNPSVGAGFSATASFSVEATFSVQLSATPTTTPSTIIVTSTPLPTTSTITTTTKAPRTTTTSIPASSTTAPTTPSPTSAVRHPR
ncbi:hypothetical protein [Nocardia asteroides]|uniref:hypothetical protein n=1 Tax=Nocardia asteroides TaxID=1824 RepID=UPI001E4183A6|nr:hypothetical protein [Nocardia asteroides]UGT63938.1 hypothetical protein LTT61_11800 [Nocardia asteroides]